ncbi:MAG: hypothetical protein NTV34_02165 [Proteobacteria bacterium]|nr:hypothetical protein [Pseudomonadota bacterium]
MANGAAAPVDQKTLDRYLGEFYEHTDLVYRFGALLTGSRDGAERVTEETFRQLILELAEVSPSANAMETLMKRTWQTWNKIRSERFHAWVHPTVSSLGKLDHEVRASIYLVDFVGFSPREAATILESSEREVRICLAGGRKRLVSGEISL